MSCCGQKRSELRRPPTAATTSPGVRSALTIRVRAFLARKAITGQRQGPSQIRSIRKG
jgi:hypothetical protein